MEVLTRYRSLMWGLGASTDTYNLFFPTGLRRPGEFCLNRERVLEKGREKTERNKTDEVDAE